MLSYLIAQTTEATNLPNGTAPERALILSKINRAAKEIFDMNDIPGSIWEQYFCVDTALSQITLPWYVGQVRAVRVNSLGAKITLHDMRPRYNYSPWRLPFLTWRLKGSVPIMTGLTASSQMTITLGAAESKTVKVTIIGATTLSAYTSETLTFNPGVTSATTSNQWLANDPHSIVSVTKDSVTATDVTVKQSSDSTITLAVIPSRLFESKNTLIQINDFIDPGQTLVGIDNNVEVLYKKPYIPFYNDNDTFVMPELEDAIIWKVREHWYSQSKDEFSASQAKDAYAKCNDLLGGIIHNNESSAEKVVNKAPDPFALGSIYPITARRFIPRRHGRFN